MLEILLKLQFLTGRNSYGCHRQHLNVVGVLRRIEKSYKTFPRVGCVKGTKISEHCHVEGKALVSKRDEN